MTRCWRIECWSNYHQEWVKIIGVPAYFKDRTKAVERLRFEAGNRRCRLLNNKGNPVLFAGVNASE